MLQVGLLEGMWVVDANSPFYRISPNSFFILIAIIYYKYYCGIYKIDN